VQIGICSRLGRVAFPVDVEVTLGGVVRNHEKWYLFTPALTTSYRAR
jgi:hypothetical protein